MSFGSEEEQIGLSNDSETESENDSGLRAYIAGRNAARDRKGMYTNPAYSDLEMINFEAGYMDYLAEVAQLLEDELGV